MSQSAPLAQWLEQHRRALRCKRFAPGSNWGNENGPIPSGREPLAVLWDRLIGESGLERA